MNIKFTDLYIQESEKKFGIKRDSISTAIMNPDKVETVDFGDDYTAIFYLKDITGEPKHLSLLVHARKFGDTDIEISRAFKIYPDMCPNIGAKRPTELLYELANRFGAEITVGVITGKFFFHQSVTFKPEINFSLVNPQDIMGKMFNIRLKSGHTYTQEFMFKYNIVNGSINIEFALTYCIDIEDYTAWIYSH